MEPVAGICWRIIGYVSKSRLVQHLGKPYRELDLQNEWDRWSPVYVANEAAIFVEDRDTFYCFKGIMKPTECGGQIENAKYIAESWEQVAKVEE